MKKSNQQSTLPSKNKPKVTPASFDASNNESKCPKCEVRYVIFVVIFIVSNFWYLFCFYGTLKIWKSIQFSKLLFFLYEVLDFKNSEFRYCSCFFFYEHLNLKFLPWTIVIENPFEHFLVFLIFKLRINVFDLCFVCFFPSQFYINTLFFI